MMCMCVGLCINKVSLQSNNNKYSMRKSCVLLSINGKRSLGQVSKRTKLGPKINYERQTGAEIKFHGNK